MKSQKSNIHWIQSDTQPNKQYAVRKIDGVWKCGCADFILRKSRKGGLCKHIMEVINNGKDNTR